MYEKLTFFKKNSTNFTINISFTFKYLEQILTVVFLQTLVQEEDEQPLTGMKQTKFLN